MSERHRSRLPNGTGFLALLLAAVAAWAGTLEAQNASPALRFDAEPNGTPMFDASPLGAAERYILIRLDENRLYVMDGRHAIWSAPVGTGTGFTLEGGGQRWEFSTPRGMLRVQRKEKDPVWIKPDWAFIRDGQPVPPPDSPLRRQRGMLGTTAIYIGYELAIHGTDRPELVLNPDPDERRVSAGCIRLTNEDARTLYYLVEVGTPILIY